MQIQTIATTPPTVSIADSSVATAGTASAAGYLSGDTVLVHAGSAWHVPLRDLVARREGIVLTLGEASVISAQRPSAYIAHEPAHLYRLTTETGRVIETTADQRLLTRAGWKPLFALDPSADRIAVVVEYPELFGRGDTDADLLRLLAYLTAGGTSGDGATAILSDEDVRADAREAVDAEGDVYTELIEHGQTRLRVYGRGIERSKTLSYLILIGVHGVRDGDKAIPDFAFGLRKEKLRLFLNRVFTCDGAADPSGRIRYRAPSIRVARQLQHLLARFGIVAAIGDPGRRPKGDDASAVLWIDSKADVVRFIEQIGFLGDKAVQAEFLRASLYDVREDQGRRDRLGPILFDRIGSIESADVVIGYSLALNTAQNFVANDFLVHSSPARRA